MNDKPYDQAFKFLAEQDPEALLVLLGYLQPGEQAEIEILPRELRAAAILPDQPYRVVTARENSIVQIEAQAWFDHSMFDRYGDYGVRSWLGYRLPIRCYVLLLTSRGLPKRFRTWGTIDAGDIRIKIRYCLIKLWLISARKVLAMNREHLLPFVPLMRGGREELEISAQRLSQVPDESQRSEMGVHFLMLGGLRYNRIDLLELIGRKSMITLEQLKESSFYQFIAEEEGLKVARDILQMQAAKRFPGFELGEQAERIRDLEALKRLGLEVSDLPDAETLRRRIAELVQADLAIAK
jgi:predicted transposase YdaD